jgi:hypothetical protein
MSTNYENEILDAIHFPPLRIQNKLKAGDKVKIDIEKYRPQKESGSITDVFWKFLENNKDSIFTLVAHNKWGIMWGIEEDSRWLLYYDFLTKV